MPSQSTPPSDKHPIKATCKSCNDLMVSERGGHFVGCKCGKSFIDRDRWFPERVRLGGDAELIAEARAAIERLITQELTDLLKNATFARRVYFDDGTEVIEGHYIDADIVKSRIKELERSHA